MTAYYNENDPFAAAWLRNLIAAGHIAPGEVDERSITDVQPDDLRSFRQCHFFAGIGGWSYALRLAGWPDDVPVWTGSCPCQPFSAAGKRKGADDERHLWPAWFGLIDACRPATIFGEQVASAEVVGHQGEGLGIPASLSPPASCEGFGSARTGESEEERTSVRSHQASLFDTGEGRQGSLRGHWIAAEPRWRAHLGQSLAGQDCPFCGLPIRQHQDCLPCGEWRDGGLGRAEDHRHGARNPWQEARDIERLVRSIGCRVAEETGGVWLDFVQSDLESAGYSFGSSVLAACGVGAPHIRQRLFWVADAAEPGRRAQPQRPAKTDGRASAELRRLCDAGWLVQPDLHGCSPRGEATQADRHGHPALAAGWDDVEWLPCRDGKSRPTQPGIHPLAHGVRGRVGRLRAYGNAIVPQVGAAFVGAYLEVTDRRG